jgi:transcriptional regulator GlxA family with amidase domain
VQSSPRTAPATGRSPGRAPGDVLVHLRRARDHIDRHYREPVHLETLAGIAGLSKYHFLRMFQITYGRTPGVYLSERRVERAQDLLRASNLTVTEVCFAVGFSSLGSFSSRFRAITGESPSQLQRRYAVSGAPRIPGCYVFMWGLAERRNPAEWTSSTAIEEKPGSGTRD